MFAAYSGGEEPQGQVARPDDHEQQYSEEEIQRVASDLSSDGRKFWSENPRLYIILRDLDRSIGISHLQLVSVFIDNDINDTWLPISKPILEFLLPLPALAQFLQAQCRVCSQPSDFQLGFRSTHGHFHSKDSSPFRTKRIIGSGHIGDVDEVWSLTDGKVYARKTIRRRLSHFPTARRHIRSFRRELQALRRINHIHCVKFEGSYTDPRHLTIIMSPVADANLRQYLDHAENSSDLIIPIRLQKWFGCLATAVRYIHAIKIRHRDIKPENILVHGRQVLLVDFELSLDWKDLCQSTTTADCGGTPLYAAPEIILHKKRNSSSDIWALGCVFLEMATVLKGKRISQMRSLFKSQAENAIFYNNEVGISQWVDQLEELSEVGNAPFSWISKMLQHNKDLRPKADAVVDLIRDSRTGSDQSSLYFGKCCRPDATVTLPLVAPCPICRTRSKRSQFPALCSCNQETRVYQSHIHWNRGSASEDLPIQLMRSSFHPYFMTRHLTRASMQELTRAIVADDGWDSLDTGVKVSCLPGHPLHLNVRTFVQRSIISSLQRDPESRSLHTHDSLPLGIYGADSLRLAQGFKEYLNSIVEDHLVEHSDFILQVRDPDHSSRVLEILFGWFHKWRETLPNHEVLFLNTAIKVVVINKILGQSPVLAEMPKVFKNGWPHRSSPENQSPKLLNRQLKVAFFLLKSNLIEQALIGLRCLVKVPGSWTTRLFVSMCLSFVLEKIIVVSREYQEIAKEYCEDETATASDVGNFCDGVYGTVFQRIYRQLSLSMKTRERDPKNSNATRHLLESLSKLRSQFEVEGQRTTERDVQARYPSPLVSALLNLVQT